ncbi:MAG: filamentous hemagglutinin N-terminal domain-containing protein, partial [Abitibacteriaceae bacterium]|nr:filamentous hemagglutinin N-terminal domain-containing protein [Abditibacteriaceae bacterium]
MRLLFRRSIGLLILLTFSTLVRRGYAQIITDGTIGGAGSLHGPHYLIPSSLGQVYGSNLFQSFKCFNLSPGESATFSGPSSIRNILSRVTGGEPSLINGLLTSSVPGANFFFVNPQGVVFGPHGKVAISGSLVVTTASFLRLKNGGIFKAWHPGDEVLTSAPPAAFGFLNPHPAAIQLNGTNLQVQDSKALSIIGGPVQLNGGDLDAPRGTLDLVSLGSIGEVGLHGEGTSVRKWGSVIISKDAFVGADNGGTISVRGGTLLVDHAGLGIGNIGSGSGANINLNLQMDLKLTNGAVLSTGNYFTERPNRNHSPTIWIEARNIVLEKASWLSNDYSKDTGAPGSIYIRANRMRISGESKVSMDTFSNGSGGHLMIQADAMQIDGPGTSAKDLTGIETKTLSKDAAAQGTSIILDARILTISRGGVVQSSTTAAAKAGNISIHADAVRLNGQSTRTDQFTAIGSQTDSSSTTAKGGNIEVDANSVALIHDGGIGTATVGKARAGDIKIHCQSLLVDGTGEIQFTGIGSQTDSSSTTAKGGNIEVDANSVALIHRGQMSADTFGAGNGGSITVRAKRILINGQGANKHQVTGISASTQQEQHGGNGGNINLIVDHLNISQHGEISADTFGDGVGGNINIQAANVLATGQDVSGRLFTGISAGTDSKQHGGRGGNIDIFTKSMSIRQGAEVRANSRGNGIGGNIKIHAQNIAVAGQDNEDQVTAITAETDELGQGGDGGSIIIEVHNLTVLRAGEITAGTSGAGNGGDVRIHADTLQIDGQGVGGDLFTGIGADTESTVHGGRGGNIALNIKNLSLKHGGEVSANSFGSGNSGDITVNAHAIFIDGQGSNMQATGIAAETDNTTNGGAGGHLRLNTQQLD